MAEVHIPAMLREWTGGQSTVEASGATVRQVIDDLDRRWPGIGDRLTEGGRLRPNLAVAVDGEVSPLGLREEVTPSSEVHFVAAIKGGVSRRHGRIARARFTCPATGGASAVPGCRIVS